jgi:hypothetical protein
MSPTRKAPKPARKLSASHKKALAEGRMMSATADRYLSAVNTPKQRGRKVSKQALEERLVEARAKAKSAFGVEFVKLSRAVERDRSRCAASTPASCSCR